MQLKWTKNNFFLYAEGAVTDLIKTLLFQSGLKNFI